MLVSNSYYKGEHDILNHKNMYYADGELVEDKVKANNKIVHPFYAVLVDQKTAYIAGNPAVVSVRQPDMVDADNPTAEELMAIEESKSFQDRFSEILGDNFDETLCDYISETSIKGIGWLHPSIDTEGNLNLILIPSEQVIPIYETQYEKELVGVIRYYTYDIVDGDKLQTRYKAEWWTKDSVEYWEQQLDNSYTLDAGYMLNPAPHWFTFSTTNPDNKQPYSWGRVPFIPLANNPHLTTDLAKIKTLIDAYDRVKSGWVNDLDDLQELIMVLRGYTGIQSSSTSGYSELGMFLKTLKNHKVISVDSDGGVDTLKSDIPIEARDKFLQITRKEIFYFGQGVDVDNERFGNSPSGVSLKFLYSSLDLKANRMINRLNTALSDMAWFVTRFINMRDNKTYDYRDVLFTFNKSAIFNEKEKIDELVASEGMLSKQTILENHPLVDDAQEELQRLEAEKLDSIEKGMVDLTEPAVNSNVSGNTPTPTDGVVTGTSGGDL
jgi:SPP1 family phage portal protein